jgi:DNA-nicking Smr family endonuclease
MKFNIGDKVRFLNDVGGGKVVKFIDKYTVLVLNDDDFEIPVPESELIPDSDFNYKVKTGNQEKVLTNTSKTSTEKKVEENYQKEDESVALFFAIVPENLKDISQTTHKTYLINDSNYECFANVMFQYGALSVSKPSKIGANSKIEIKNLALGDFNDIDTIVVQALFFKFKAHEIKPMVSKEIKIHASKFFKQNTYTENDFFEENAHIICVFDESEKTEDFPEIKAEEIEKAIKLKESDSVKMNQKPESKSSKSTELREIDLHIQELLDDFSAMTPKEMLDYQMDCFRSEMKKAIAERVKKIVFIHGKGDGVLKTELRQELKTNYKRYQFQDASFQQYGFGATMVIIG